MPIMAVMMLVRNILGPTFYKLQLSVTPFIAVISPFYVCQLC